MNLRAPLAAAFLAALLPAVAIAAGDFRYGIDSDLAHDSNVSRGLADADTVADRIVTIEGSATRSVLLGPESGLLLRAAARYARYLDLTDLSHFGLAGRAAWRTQRDRSFGSPWYEVAVDGLYLRHADSELRDGFQLSLSGSIGSHLTDRVRVAGGVAFDKRSGGGLGLYDLTGNRLWATLDYRVGLRDVAYARLTRSAGEQVFTAISAASQALLLQSGYTILAADTALADGFGGVATTAYRADATSWNYELGYNLPISRTRTLDFSFGYFVAKTDLGAYQYDGLQARAAYLYRFQ
ncbi:MAG TPA: hypothetical protein VIS73_05540 [Rhodocyclaceae bacterium]